MFYYPHLSAVEHPPPPPHSLRMSPTEGEEEGGEECFEEDQGSYNPPHSTSHCERVLNHVSSLVLCTSEATGKAEEDGQGKEQEEEENGDWEEAEEEGDWEEDDSSELETIIKKKEQ